MPRRGIIIKRTVAPDAKYGNATISRFMNRVMRDGKKSTAEKVVYAAFGIIESQAKSNPVDVFEQALKNTTPLLQVKSRRVGGANYQVPVEVKSDRGMMLAMRWILDYSRSRSGKSMASKLAAEIMDAAKGEGSAVKKRQDTHKMAEANKAFAHLRW
ncbi:MAG TPA: 30S ribosomal protein S7 [Dehalococcoidia bacterium]|nr:30S ribosomal protein S7 [Dehalococcoidia bacterium]